jgi:hypothetical protein
MEQFTAISALWTFAHSGINPSAPVRKPAGEGEPNLQSIIQKKGTKTELEITG